MNKLYKILIGICLLGSVIASYTFWYIFLGKTNTDKLGVFPTHVSSGDTITSADWNSIIDATVRSATTPLIYRSGDGNISIATSSASVSGFLTTTDWNTFNNKVGLTSFSGTTPITYRSSDGNIYIATSTTAVSGFLTSTDWNTFNNKQATVTDGTNLTFTGATLNVDDPFSVTKLTATSASTTYATLPTFWSTNGTITNASSTYLSIATNGWLGSNPIVSNVTGNQTQLAAFSGTNTITPTSTIGISFIAGLGTIATQNSNNVSITGGSVTGITDLTVADGGTGASTLSGFLYGNGTNAFTGTTTPYFTSGFYTGSASYISGKQVDGFIYPAFTYATSTAWAGTTTIALGTAFIAETWSGVQCFTDAGTLNVAFNDGTNFMNFMTASTTAGTMSLTTNNTFTAAEKRYVQIGTPASSPTVISCTIKKNF